MMSRAPGCSGANAVQHLQPVLPGQPQVEQHQVVVLSTRLAACGAILDPVGISGRLSARPPMAFWADHGVVFNQQYPHEVPVNDLSRAGSSRPLPEDHKAGKQGGPKPNSGSGQAASAQGLSRNPHH